MSDYTTGESFVNRSLCLRLVQYEAEAEEIHELLCVPEVSEYLADTCKPPPSIAEAWIDQSMDDYLMFGGGLWALEAYGDASVLGLVRLSDIDARAVQLTYLLHPRAWGRGYATRMSRSAMAGVFEVGLANSIWAGADVDNRRSIAVMERLGMTLRSEVRYPAGPGVEYVIDAGTLDIRGPEPILLWTGDAENEWCA